MQKMLIEIRSFARNWIDAWNRGDAESVLEHYHENVVFKSPTAMAVVGVPIVSGKSALREYWMRALRNHNSLQFLLDRVLWDPDVSELAMLYTSEINGTKKRVCEILKFNTEQLVIFSEVFHGIDI